MPLLTGQCLCGQVKYQYDGELGSILHCHCSQCRQWHGSAFRTRAVAKTKDFTWLSGESLVAKYDGLPNAIKTFCKNCGSNLISYYKSDPDIIGLPLGGINEDPGTRPEYHIFTGFKAPWYEIADNLPQFGKLPDDSNAIHQVATDLDTSQKIK